ncbi:hypothetical protein [Thiobacillus sp.]
MKTPMIVLRRTGLALAIGACLPASALAGSEIELLQQQVEALQSQLQAIQTQLSAQQEKSASKDDIQALKKEVKDVSKTHSEWKDASSVVHLAGYGSVGYTDNEGTKGRFSQVQFSPIFHYQYKDLIMLGGELEITNDPDGETSTGLEYLTLDLYLNDYATLVAGKFLSPIGQFRQNIHPGWINKLPSAPPGFGHDGAAPLSDTGLQVRGGFPLGSMRSNYALYVSNGPELEAVTEDGEVELEGIMAEGRTSDVDGNKVVGGRFGLLPVPGLEVALSFATGKAAITSFDMMGVSGEQSRDYDVFGGDFAWKWRNLDLRGEYVQTKVGSDNSGGLTASNGAKWKTWYTQAAYKFLPKVEGVVRYTNFDSPHAAEDQKQWALGVNYLYASNIIAKLAYEFNDGQAGKVADDNSILAQLAYGF